MRELTSSKAAAAPDTSDSGLTPRAVGYLPRKAEAKAVTILILSGVFLAVLVCFMLMMQVVLILGRFVC